MEILELNYSPKETKRFRITLKIGDKIKSFDFGSKTGETFIDHKDEKKRENWYKRHLANNVERGRIEGLIPSPSLFSARILWGESTDIFENLVSLNKDLKSHPVLPRI